MSTQQTIKKKGSLKRTRQNFWCFLYGWFDLDSYVALYFVLFIFLDWAELVSYIEDLNSTMGNYTHTATLSFHPTARKPDDRQYIDLWDVSARIGVSETDVKGTF